MARHRLFSDYFSATLLMGSTAGLAAAYPAGWPVGELVIGPAIAVIPGLVRRSGRRVLLGVLLGLLIPVCVATGVGNSLAINPDRPLPRSVYQTPGVVIINPHYDSVPLGARSRALVVLLSYLLALDLLTVVLRGGTWRQELRGLGAAALSDLVVLSLYPLSWFATVSWGWQAPGSSFAVDLICLGVFAFIFPAKYLVLHYLYAPRAFWSRSPDETEQPTGSEGQP